MQYKLIYHITQGDYDLKTHYTFSNWKDWRDLYRAFRRQNIKIHSYVTLSRKE